MFDELAQDEEDAEDYDMEALEARTEANDRFGHHPLRDDDDDTATLVGRGPGSVMADDAVVFEIGDEDAHELSEDEDSVKKRSRGQDHSDSEAHEREGLMKDV